MAYSVNNSLSNFTESNAISKADAHILLKKMSNSSYKKASSSDNSAVKMKQSDSSSNLSNSNELSSIIQEEENNNQSNTSNDYEKTPLLTDDEKADKYLLDLSKSSSSSDDYKIIDTDKSSTVITSYYTLAAAVGANTRGITKGQLEGYLEQIISSNDPNIGTIRFVKTLISNFDNLANESGYVTTVSLAKAADEPQDYKTVTSEQTESPVDLKI